MVIEDTHWPRCSDEVYRSGESIAPCRQDFYGKAFSSGSFGICVVCRTTHGQDLAVHTNVIKGAHSKAQSSCWEDGPRNSDVILH